MYALGALVTWMILALLLVLTPRSIRTTFKHAAVPCS